MPSPAEVMCRERHLDVKECSSPQNERRSTCTTQEEKNS